MTGAILFLMYAIPSAVLLFYAFTSGPEYDHWFTPPE
jgi:hypothetical protein